MFAKIYIFSCHKQSLGFIRTDYNFNSKPITVNLYQFYLVLKSLTKVVSYRSVNYLNEKLRVNLM